MTAPAIRRLSSASYSDRSAIVGPRPTFSITADARIAAKHSALTIPTVSAFDGTETTKKSAELQNSPRLFKTVLGPCAYRQRHDWSWRNVLRRRGCRGTYPRDVGRSFGLPYSHAYR